MFSDCEVISSYSRAQGIADSVLVDVSDIAREEGFKFPVAMTCEVFAVCEPKTEGGGQSLRGRLHDLFFMLHAAARTCGGSRVDFAVSFLDGQRHSVNFCAVCGPGDDPLPVITIMLEGQD